MLTGDMLDPVLPRAVEDGIDRRTGRTWGDHGTSDQALNFALDHCDDYAEMGEFLRAWREGDLDEWPEFYGWLAKEEADG